MADLAQHFEHLGYRKIDLFFDRNPTHKKKMQTLYKDLVKDRKIKVEMNFYLMAAYSPDLNLVEYAIHLIRQKLLHQYIEKVYPD